tara:strand:- start:150 stop:833 length:684 start_codon:yes stop_codon:yes gene_type:complete
LVSLADRSGFYGLTFSWRTLIEVLKTTISMGKGAGLRFLAGIAKLICAVNLVIGKTFAWLALAIVIICFTVVVQRYLFATSYVWMQDLYIWLNGAMFTAVAGFALLRDDHVRVDIFYRPASMARRALIDLIGVFLFLLPFCWVVYQYSIPFVIRAWSYHEGSANVGGMPGLYILKTFIIGFVALIALQGLAMAIRSVLVLSNNAHLVPQSIQYSPDHSAADHPQGAA